MPACIKSNSIAQANQTIKSYPGNIQLIFDRVDMIPQTVKGFHHGIFLLLQLGYGFSILLSIGLEIAVILLQASIVFLKPLVGLLKHLNLRENKN